MLGPARAEQWKWVVAPAAPVIRNVRFEPVGGRSESDLCATAAHAFAKAEISRPRNASYESKRFLKQLSQHECGLRMAHQHELPTVVQMLSASNENV
jgi:hypothetical protein